METLIAEALVKIRPTEPLMLANDFQIFSTIIKHGLSVIYQLRLQTLRYQQLVDKMIGLIYSWLIIQNVGLVTLIYNFLT
jgi:hypothetical protein